LPHFLRRDSNRNIFLESLPMLHPGIRTSAPSTAALLAGIALLISPRTMLAQRHGGGEGGGGGGHGSQPVICVHDCPAVREGLSKEDDLKAFRRAIAVQATDEQRAAFAKLAQYTQAASDQLKEFHESLQKILASSWADRETALDQAMEKARASNQNFLGSFSDAQKSGLKEITNKLSKADSDLDKEIKTLDQIARTPKPDSEQVTNSAANLVKELTGFQSEQLALGKEMGILPSAENQGLSFNLPQVTSAINVAGQTISIPASGAMSRTSTENGVNLFSLKLVADLADLQQNVTAILRPKLARSPRCGERIDLQQATLTPMVPASLVVVNLSYERWVCPPGPGMSPEEAVAAEGALEVKLTPSFDPKTGLTLTSEITRVDAEGSLRNLLRSGELGETLRDQIAAALLFVMQQATDPKVTLPLAARDSATFQKAQFQDAGADQLSLVLDGQLSFTTEQAQQFSTQMKQRLSAQGVSPP
jgi:hypothetical protein